MKTLALRTSLAAFLLLLTGIALSAADPGEDLVGTWAGEFEGMKEVWTIKNDAGKWSVVCVYMEKDKQIGAFHGKDPKLSGGKLTFIQAYDTKPRAGWKDNALITVSRTDDKLSYRWQIAKTSGSRTLTKSDPVEAPKDVAKVTPPAKGTIGKPPIPPKKDPPKESTPFKLPPSAKAGETIRLIIVPIAAGLLNMDELKSGKATDIRADFAGDANDGKLNLDLTEWKSQPEKAKWDKGAYYVGTITYQFNGKKNLGGAIYSSKPYPTGALVNLKYIGEAKADLSIHIGKRPDSDIHLFEATVGK